MEEVPGVSVQDSSGASGEGAMLTPSTVSHQFNLFLRRTTRSLTWEGGLPNKLPSLKHRNMYWPINMSPLHASNMYWLINMSW